MEREPAPAGLLFSPPPGTRVEDWLLVGRHGHGASGVVYRALRIGLEAEGPVALKMALFPWDPRFMREVGMLSQPPCPLPGSATPEWIPSSAH